MTPSLKKASIILKLVLFLSMIIVALAAASLPKTEGQTRQSLSLNPSIGPVGTEVSVNGVWFSVGREVSIKFGDTEVATAQVALSMGRITASFTVPRFATIGTHLVTASDDVADYASATFMVTSSQSSTSPFAPSPSGPASTGDQTQPETSPTDTGWVVPTYYSSQSPKPSGVGFWTPLIIGVVAVTIAAALLVSGALLLRRRGEKELLPREEPPQFKPAPSHASRSPTAASTPRMPVYNSQQFTSPAYTPRSNRPLSYSQQLSKPSITPYHSQPQQHIRPTSSTKVCPRCKHPVRDDYNICPYCNKKLR